jgi:hypothetical protein
MTRLQKMLMERDRITAREAQEMIDAARAELEERIAEGDLLGAEDVCLDVLELEPDYLDDLL